MIALEKDRNGYSWHGVDGLLEAAGTDLPDLYPLADVVLCLGVSKGGELMIIAPKKIVVSLVLKGSK